MIRNLFILWIAFGISSAYSADATSTSTTTLNASPYRKVNFSIKPIGILFGTIGAQMQFRMTKNIGVGIMVDWFQNSTTTRRLSSVEYGLVGSYYFSGEIFQSGWIATGAALFNNVDITRDNRVIRSGDQKDIYGISLVGGHMWSLASHINVHLGAGPQMKLNESRERFSPIMLAQIGASF